MGQRQTLPLKYKNMHTRKRTCIFPCTPYRFRDKLIVQPDAICKATFTPAFCLSSPHFVLTKMNFKDINLNTAITKKKSKDGKSGVQIVSVWRIRVGSSEQECSEAWFWRGGGTQRERQRERESLTARDA